MHETARQLGCSPLDLQVAKAAAEHLDNRAFGRILALIGDTCLIKAGHEGKFAQQLYCRLWRSPEWNPSFDTLVEPVQDALGRVNIKQASFGTATIASMFPRAGTSISDNMFGILSALALGGGVVGSGVGALNWHLKRMTQADDAKAEELDTKADFYKQLADEIGTDARLRKWQQGA
jgi:hypothetical protein